jgi:hypothetical protein
MSFKDNLDQHSPTKPPSNRGSAITAMTKTLDSRTLVFNESIVFQYLSATI